MCKFLNRLFGRKQATMQYVVKDSQGNIVASFSTPDAGPFTVELSTGGGAQTQGGGGPANPTKPT